jgi:Putative peptidoglycan binding domain
MRRHDEAFLISYLSRPRTGRWSRARKGTTDADGLLSEPIPPNAVRGEIVLDKAEDQQTFSGRLGQVRPMDSLAGIQARLNSLHSLCGEEDGELNEFRRAALREFQARYECEVPGEVDAATRAKLKEVFRS